MKVSGGIVRGDEEDSNEEDNAIWKGKKEEWRDNSGKSCMKGTAIYQERERVVFSRILYFRSSSVVNLMSRISSFLRAVSPGDWRRKDVTVNSDRDGNIIETETHRGVLAKNPYPPFMARLSSNQ